ncbi:class I SAM-dependent methyltransferase [Candidatus Woesearchaeota archaeon]|nr:class I SAM-dependent methyltransferase [Candidatus Woesearchaeota archaeon]
MEFARYYKGAFVRAYVWVRQRIIPLEEIGAHVPVRGLIVDIGSGCGVLANYLARRSRTRNVVGLELDPHRVRRAQESAARVPNLSFVAKDIVKDPAIMHADCLLLVDLLHHIPPPAQTILIDACATRLRRGGVLVVKEVDPADTVRIGITWLLDKLMTKGGRMWYLDRRRLEDDLRERGFRVEGIRVRRALFPHYLLVCRR